MYNKIVYLNFFKTGSKTATKNKLYPTNPKVSISKQRSRNENEFLNHTMNYEGSVTIHS